MNPPFDVVIGSDVVYREDVFKPLIETLDMITNKDSLVILAYKPRGLSEEKFFFWLKKRLSQYTETHIRRHEYTARPYGMDTRPTFFWYISDEVPCSAAS